MNSTGVIVESIELAIQRSSRPPAPLLQGSHQQPPASSRLRHAFLPPSHVVESLLSLQSFFTPFVPDLPSLASVSSSLKGESEKDPELIYKTWLKSKFDESVRSLVGVVVSSDPTVALKVHTENVGGGDGSRARLSLEQTIHKIHSIISHIPPP
ncbi:hypothetical protein SAY86_021447 [Trapa natans]|uniref:Uncharacterized protein n=1 Tax=Trapa natans TaxID=22666 RepID=A0AAN7RFM9_TRANT|nr:hypothetical protein SAY86_021447 [Trapa natans]